jgi:hypothetical protein
VPTGCGVDTGSLDQNRKLNWELRPWHPLEKFLAKSSFNIEEFPTSGKTPFTQHEDLIEDIDRDGKKCHPF